MPQTIEIVGRGTVEFPDGMSDDEMASILRTNPPFGPEEPRVDQADEAASLSDPDSDSPNVAGAKAAWQALQQPLIPLPEAPTGAALKQALPFLNDKTAEYLSGANAAALDLIGGIESTLGIATMAAGGLTKIASGAVKTAAALGAKAGAAYFGYEAAKNIGPQVVTAEEALKAGDVATGTRAALGAAASAVIAPTIAGHLAAPLARPRPLVPFVENTARAMGAESAVPRGTTQAVAPLTTEAVAELPTMLGVIKIPENLKIPEVKAPIAELPPVIAEIKAPEARTTPTEESGLDTESLGEAKAPEITKAPALRVTPGQISGPSILKDKSQNPLVAGHGTPDTGFNPSAIEYSDWGHSGPGIYFTTDKSVMSRYASGHGATGGGRVIRAVVLSNNPFGEGVFTKAEAERINVALLNNGYTPVKNLEGKSHQYLFDRKQEQALDTWDSVMKDAGYDSVKIPRADESELVVYDNDQLLRLDENGNLPKSIASSVVSKYSLRLPPGYAIEGDNYIYRPGQIAIPEIKATETTKSLVPAV